MLKFLNRDSSFNSTARNVFTIISLCLAYRFCTSFTVLCETFVWSRGSKISYLSYFGAIERKKKCSACVVDDKRHFFVRRKSKDVCTLLFALSVNEKAICEGKLRKCGKFYNAIFGINFFSKLITKLMNFCLYWRIPWGNRVSLCCKIW